MKSSKIIRTLRNNRKIDEGAYGKVYLTKI